MTVSTRPEMTLDRSIIPIHYNLKIVPSPINFTFLGECSIDICIAEPTYGITLNAKELNIQTAVARDHLSSGGYSVTAASVSYNVEEETITLEFPELLYVGASWILDVAYIGLVNDKLNGFYRSVYTDADHNVHQLTTTQFQSTYARRAFPCWDEPSIKATFSLTLVAPQAMTCLSNMSIKSTTILEDGMQEVTFFKTPTMATYLLAWMIGDFDYIEAYTSGEFNGEPVQCRLYAPVGLARHGQYSLDLAVQSVEYFSRLFNIPYPLPKLDLVAVPDFSPGAMENWGLITFRTYAVLLDENGTNDRKREIAATVIHEISHQWFGNLVTMDWWSDLWLFEGFATYLAYIVVDDLFPGWDIWSEFVNRIQEVLKHDALRTSHPVEVGVENPSEITQIFDEVSYMKGASVLRMLDAWLGQDQLFRGIRKFMLKYMWSNANTEDLWVTLAEECQVDVPGFMSKWTRQTGHPVLSITELDESTILIRQSLFLSTGDVREDEDTLLWPVPLAFATADDPTPRNIMLDAKEMILKVDTTKWYKFNMGQTGFYRVAYPPRTLDLLGQTLALKAGQTLDAADRIGLLTDAAALVASGHTPTSSFLTLLKYFENEENYIVWTEISYRLQELFSVWLEQPAHVIDALKEVQRRLFTKLVKRLGWDYPEEEDPATGNLRALAIRYAGRAGDPEIVAEARRRFRIFMGNRDMSAIPPDLRFPVFEIVIRTTVGVEEYDAVVNYYREAYMPGEKVVSLGVMGYGHSAELIHRTLEFAMSPEVRTQDILRAIATLRSSVLGRTELWSFMRRHWDILYERHIDDVRFLEYFVLFTIGSFSNLEKYHEVQQFFATKDTSSYERILATCLEGMRMRILWLQRGREDVERWLRINGYLTTGVEEDHHQQLINGFTDVRLSSPTGSLHSSSMLGHGLPLTDAGRSRSNSSVDGFSSSEVYKTPRSDSSATSSCSSSPPSVHMQHNHRHRHHRHAQQRQHQHHQHQHQHQHRDQPLPRLDHESSLYLEQTHHVHSHYHEGDTAALTDDQTQISQFQQYHGEQQQQQQHQLYQHEIKADLEATMHHMNERIVISAATATVAPRTLEGEMELLHVGGDDEI